MMGTEKSHHLELGQLPLLLDVLHNEFLLARLFLLLQKLEQLHNHGSTQPAVRIPPQNKRSKITTEKGPRGLDESHLFGVRRLLQLLQRTHPALQRGRIEPRRARASVLSRNPRRLLRGFLALPARRRWGLLIRRRRGGGRGGGGGGEAREAEHGAAPLGVSPLGAEREGGPRGDGGGGGLGGGGHVCGGVVGLGE